MSSKVLLLRSKSQPIINGLLDEFKYQSLLHWPSTEFITHDLSVLNQIFHTDSQSFLQQQLQQDIQSIDYFVFALANLSQFDLCIFQRYLNLFQLNQNIPTYIFVVNNQLNQETVEQLEANIKQTLNVIGIVNITFIDIYHTDKNAQYLEQKIKQKIAQLMHCDS